VIAQARRTASGERRPNAARRERDLALLALHEAGLSFREIARLRLADVRSFASGKVTVRLAVDDGILRRSRRFRFVLLDGVPANRVARHFESRAGDDRSYPLFTGRWPGAPLSHSGVSRILTHAQAFAERDRS
jgi:hypothetical protein